MSDEIPQLSRDELIALVEKTHKDATYVDATAAGKTFAAHSKLPTLVAHNLGAGFGQWDFFPEAAEIVDFACSYVAPTNEEEMVELARRWSSDDANKRHTVLNLIGKEILRHELKRLDVPKLHDLVGAIHGTKSIEARKALGFEIRPEKAPRPSREPRAPREGAPAVPEPRLPPEKTAEGAFKMPKPKFVKPPPKAAPAAARKFTHPKFGEGVLEKTEGVGDEMKLTIKFGAGSKTLLAKFVTEVPGDATPG